MECGVALQGSFLLRRGNIFIATQPVSAMALHLSAWLLALGSSKGGAMVLLAKSPGERQAGQGKGADDR